MREVTTQQIHQVLKSRFSGQELATLCFELAIEYDDLPGPARDVKARELVLLMNRRGRLPDLTTAIEQHRPQIVWEAELQLDASGIEQVPGEPPYKGMAYFDEADAHLFFGREALTAELLTRLSQHPFLAVIGASGSGKSSLVRAGLLPALKGTKLPDAEVCLPEDCEGWLYRMITPTDRPLEALAECLSNSPRTLRDNSVLMAEDERGLHFAARYALKEQGGERLCLVVDQFEELFTLCRNPKERQAFVDNLLNAVRPKSGGLTTMILTLRADFYAHCAQYDHLRQALETDQKYIGAMNQAQLQRAITSPAQEQGWAFAPGLVEMLLQDVGQEPGRLPLLSHALLETWHRREENRLTFAGYVGAGGLYGAIAQTAEMEFNRLSAGQQAIARNIFLRLTELGTGSEDTRRRAPLQELVPQPEQASEVEAVLARLATARLITTNEDSVEVVHEALIREWHSLRRWLGEDREGLQIQRRLTEAANEWEQQERHADYLYRGLPLAEAQQWAESNNTSLSLLESDFLEQSQAAMQRLQWQRYGLMASSVALVIAVALLFAFSQSRNASEQVILADKANTGATRASSAEGTAQAEAARALEAEGTAQAEAIRANANAEVAAAQEALAIESATLAQARLLAAQGKTVFEDDPLLGLALIMEGWALVRDSGETTQDSVLDSDSRQRVWQWGRLAQLGQGVAEVFANPNETWLVVRYNDAPGELRRAEDGALVETLTGEVDRVIFSPNGSWLVVSYVDAPSELRRAEDGALMEALAVDVLYAYFSPNETWLVLDYWRAPGELRRAEDSALIAALADEVNLVRFSPDETWLVVGYADAPGELRRAEDGTLIATLVEEVQAVTFSPDETWLVVDYGDAPGELRRAEDGALIEPLAGMVNRVTFSPNESRLALDYTDAPGELRRVEDSALIKPLAGVVNRVTFSPNESWLVVDYGDAPSELRRAEDGTLIAALADEVQAVTFSPDETWLVVDYGDAPGELRRAEDGALIEPLASVVNSITFSPNESWLVLKYLKTPSELRRAEDGALIATLADVVSNGTFSPNESWLVLDYLNMPGELRQAENGTLIEALAGRVQAVTLSPNESWLVLGYIDAPGELRRAEDGTLIAVLAGDIDLLLSDGNNNVTLSSNETWLVAAYRDGKAQLWDTSGVWLADLGVNVQGSIFLPEQERLVVWHQDGTAYLLDLAWLEAMNGQVDTLLPRELVQLACDYPLAHGELDEVALQGYLDEVGISAPQACP